MGGVLGHQPGEALQLAVDLLGRRMEGGELVLVVGQEIGAFGILGVVELKQDAVEAVFHGDRVSEQVGAAALPEIEPRHQRKQERERRECADGGGASPQDGS